MTDKRIPTAAIRRSWGNTSLTATEAGALVGLSKSQVRKRAAKLGLPPRKPGRPKLLPDDLFAALWKANLMSREFSRCFGYGEYMPYQVARRLGLPTKRGRGSDMAMIENRLSADELRRLAEIHPAIFGANHPI